MRLSWVLLLWTAGLWVLPLLLLLLLLLLMSLLLLLLLSPQFFCLWVQRLVHIYHAALVPSRGYGIWWWG